MSTAFALENSSAITHDTADYNRMVSWLDALFHMLHAPSSAMFFPTMLVCCCPRFEASFLSVNPGSLQRRSDMQLVRSSPTDRGLLLESPRDAHGAPRLTNDHGINKDGEGRRTGREILDSFFSPPAHEGM